MKQNREIVQKYIGLSEGGYVNNPKDPGGATDRGITQRTYTAWLKMNGEPNDSVRGISKEIAEQIIFENYMNPIWFDDLPSGLDYVVADYSVNSGPARAVKDLQRLVGVPADGIMGPQTLAAIKAVADEHDIQEMIERYCDARLAFMKVIRHSVTKELLWKTFGKGWQTRVDTVRARALNMANGWAVAPDELLSPGLAPGKAPEPDAPQTGAESIGGLLQSGGIMTAAGALVAPLGGLHPVAQGIAMVALVVAALAALWALRDRAKRRAAGLP